MASDRIERSAGASMRHAPLSSVPQKLLRVASTINEDATLPLRVPVLTISFLRRLSSLCDHSAKPLGRFLLQVRCSHLVDEIIRILLPREFQELRAELERLQVKKEESVANQEWPRAIALRDQTDLLKNRLCQMGQANAIDVQPDHIVQAIANLGFNEAIDLTG
jgi:hypothetical protein